MGVGWGVGGCNAGAVEVGAVLGFGVSAVAAAAGAVGGLAGEGAAEPEGAVSVAPLPDKLDFNCS